MSSTPRAVYICGVLLAKHEIGLNTPWSVLKLSWMVVYYATFDDAINGLIGRLLRMCWWRHSVLAAVGVVVIWDIHAYFIITTMVLHVDFVTITFAQFCNSYRVCRITIRWQTPTILLWWTLFSRNNINKGSQHVTTPISQRQWG